MFDAVAQNFKNEHPRGAGFAKLAKI